MVEVHLHENTHSILINGHDTDQPILLDTVAGAAATAVTPAAMTPDKLLFDSPVNGRQNGYVETHF